MEFRLISHPDRITGSDQTADQPYEGQSDTDRALSSVRSGFNGSLRRSAAELMVPEKGLMSAVAAFTTTPELLRCSSNSTKPLFHRRTDDLRPKRKPLTPAVARARSMGIPASFKRLNTIPAATASKKPSTGVSSAVTGIIDHVAQIGSLSIA